MAVFKKKENAKTKEDIDEGFEIEQSSTIEQILDPNNTEPIVLFTQEGFKATFEQIAIVPFNGGVYVLLRPIDKIDGINEGEAIIFKIDYNEEELEYFLELEIDEVVNTKVFELYAKLFEDAAKESGLSGEANEEPAESTSGGKKGK